MKLVKNVASLEGHHKQRRLRTKVRQNHRGRGWEPDILADPQGYPQGNLPFQTHWTGKE